MKNVHGDGEGSGPGTGPSVRVRYSLSCTGRIGFQFDLGSGSDVKTRER